MCFIATYSLYFVTDLNSEHTEQIAFYIGYYFIFKSTLQYKVLCATIHVVVQSAVQNRLEEEDVLGLWMMMLSVDGCDER